ncbi:pkb-activating kinase-like protein [Modicella reniformis]|uniref:non-specific serine/threonine protein kinase n=1 Tax=Modicella reniformis TaxID=1440133 RepID=A0A9P6LSC3_9FUNG|nr:pkb-activating kinase-like protein [Modicella reniformis]
MSTPVTSADPQDSSSSSAPGSSPVLSTSATTPQPLTAGDTTSSDDSTAPTSSTAAVPVRKRTLADYRLGRTLGEGSYSTVVAGVDLSNKRDYAIKVLDKRHIIREKKVKYVNIEKNTLYKLDHPGVVKLYSTFQDSSSLYYVLELCQNGELLTFIKRLGSFDENCTRFYAAQILTAIEYIHHRGVIHRDLKPENILLDHRMYIKLTDFGTAKMLEPSEDGTESDRANSFVGTAEYVSPELLTEKAACKSSDLWALGCIIYQLLAGRPPFKGSNEYQTFQKIVKLEYSFPAGFPATAMDLVSRLLVHDPNERLGANNTIDKLKQHPFFDGVEWDELWTQPAPRLMPYLPPTPAHNTEPLRSDHDACLWNVNRAGDTLMVVDPFRELGDSASSVDNSGRDSLSESDDGLQRSAGALEAVSPTTNATATAAAPKQATTVVVTGPVTTSQDLPEMANTHGNGAPAAVNSASDHSGGAASNALLSTSPSSKSTSVGAAIKTSARPSNGHTKSKSTSRNAFVALFLPNSNKKQSAKNSKNGSNNKQIERDEEQKKTEISHSSASLAVTANEISAYSKRAQLDLQAELSPWQSFLLPTEMIIYQSPVLKRKGLFSRSCILVLTDFPRLLYFDDSNHYFAQLFNSNTNDAFSYRLQQQRFVQWEQLEHQRLYPSQHPSSSLESQPQSSHQHPRRSSAIEGLTTSNGIALVRNGSGRHGHQQTHSEHTPGQALSGEEDEATTTQPSSQQGAPTRSARASLDHPPHHHHQHSHQSHHPQQTNGHNKIDVEKKVSAISESSSGSHLASGATELLAKSSLTNLAAGIPPGNSSIVSRSTAPHEQANGGSSSSKTSSVTPTGSPAMIKASKKQAKLRGEIFFTASVVSEIKGKKCFFIHTTKKSYYFEELKEGDAERWVKVLGRCMEEWFGELGGGSGAVSTTGAGAGTGKGRRYSKQLVN